MLAGNLKRGFNRSFFVLAVVWILYWAIIVPANDNELLYKWTYENEATQTDNCWANQSFTGSERNTCIKAAKADADHDLAQDNLYRHWDTWLIILLYGLGGTALAYGMIRGLTLILLWIWRGYKGG